MDREKQIEEIAKVICGGCPDNKECMHCLCADWYRAEALYNIGYRKQGDVIYTEESENESSLWKMQILKENRLKALLSTIQQCNSR